MWTFLKCFLFLFSPTTTHTQPPSLLSSPPLQINMYINSPGGSVTSGLAIYDTMQYIANPIHTLCVGQACSMASILLSAGTPGQRRALPNARVMIHQPMGGAQVSMISFLPLAHHARTYGLSLSLSFSFVFRSHLPSQSVWK